MSCGEGRNIDDEELPAPDTQHGTLGGGVDQGVVPIFLDFGQMPEQPFGGTPDPGYPYLSRTQREVLASLYFGVEADWGFMALIAQPRMGKTTLLFQLSERVRKSTCVAFLFQTQCDSREILRYLVADMDIDIGAHDLVQMHKQLNDALIRLKHVGMRSVLVIDEAQNPDDNVTKNISCSGVLFRGEDLAEVGSSAAISLVLPNEMIKQKAAEVFCRGAVT